MPTPNVAPLSRTQSMVLNLLADAGKPQDAYQVAKASGLTPMAAGQTLATLAGMKFVSTRDPLGTANDLAARYGLGPASP